jgi:glyoxylase-like metal-dependent hydrolase (beta-lactamase superfamily II)
MVDSGYPESLNAFQKTLSKNSITFSQVKYLIITHFHPDHAGLVQPLMDYGIKLLLHENQNENIAWINNYFEEHIHKKYKPIINENIYTLSTSESKKLLEENEINGLIVATPGHTDDSITLVIDNVAFVGDLPKYYFCKTSNLKIFLESWNRIIESNVKEIYPGHGDKYLIE